MMKPLALQLQDDGVSGRYPVNARWPTIRESDGLLYPSLFCAIWKEIAWQSSVQRCRTRPTACSKNAASAAV